MSSAPSHSRSLATVFGGTAGQLVTQFLLQVVVARQFGASADADAYQAAFLWPMSLGMVIAGGLTVAYPPASRRYPEDDPRTRSLLPVAAVLGVAGCLPLVTLGLAFTGPLLAHTFPGLPADRLALAERLFQVLAWNLPLAVLVGLFQAALHARLNFVVPAIGSVLGPAVTLAITIAAASSNGIIALAWGTVAGSLVAVLLQGAVLATASKWPTAADFADWMRPVSRLAVPSALSLLIMRVDGVVDGYVLASDQAGCLSLWGYAQRITTPFLMLTSGVLSTVAFPRLSLAAARGPAETAREFARSLRLLQWLGLPAVAVVALFNLPLIRDLFQRGQFTAENAVAVAQTVGWLTGLVIGGSVAELCAKTLYALHESRMPLIIAVFAIGITAVLKLTVVREGDLTTLAIINSCCSLGGAMVYMLLVRRRLGPAVFAGLLAPFARCLAATLLAVTAGAGVVALNGPLAGLTGLVAGAVVYGGALWLTGEVERFREDAARDGG